MNVLSSLTGDGVSVENEEDPDNDKVKSLKATNTPTHKHVS